MQNEYVILKSPVKIGDYDRVKSYAQGLTKGEEQLLITRDCKFYLTTGAGGYLEFKTINSGITLDQVTKMVSDLNTNLSSDITTLENAVTSLGLEFDKYIDRTEFEQLATKVDNLTVDVDDLTTRMDNVETDADHSNRTILDKFSEDTTGNPLFNGKKIVADFDTSGLEDEIADLNNRSIIGSSLDYLYCKLNADDVFTSSQNIPFAKVSSNNLDINTGVITLKKGKTYSIKYALYETTGRWKCLYDITNSKEIGARGDSYYNTLCTATIFCDKDIQIAARVSGTTGPVSSLSSFIEVQEIGRTVIIDPAEDAKKIQFEYGMFRMNEAQAALSVNDFIKFNIMPTGNMLINASTYQIPLKANKKYNISINISGVFHNTVFALYNITTGTRVQILYGAVNDTDYNYLSTANFIYTPTEDCTIGLKCYAIYGEFTSIDHLNTQITIQEIAQPYYFNYYKDSLSSTVLFEGNANAVGIYTLNDDVKNYEKLEVYSSVGTNVVKSCSIVDCKSILNTVSDQSINAYFDLTTFFSMLYHFDAKKMIIDFNTIGTAWVSIGPAKIYKIIGIGYNYDNPYRDIVSSVEEFNLTDAEADSDITDVWSEVGI